jgi:aspartyl-tRNA(Asn)/glutamyl-tRNA(Gln) amidotransferase subunit C
MALSQEEVLAIARLARLQVPAERLPALAQQLSGILDFVAQMNTMDTRNVEPLAHPLEVSARLREDTVTESDQRREFQAIAPAVDAGLYLVPKVIE